MPPLHGRFSVVATCHMPCACPHCCPARPAAHGTHRTFLPAKQCRAPPVLCLFCAAITITARTPAVGTTINTIPTGTHGDGWCGHVRLCFVCAVGVPRAALAQIVGSRIFVLPSPPRDSPPPKKLHQTTALAQHRTTPHLLRAVVTHHHTPRPEQALRFVAPAPRLAAASPAG